MYKIGEFSKITNLTKKALRYYDEQGILKPSFRGENNYRFYQESDYDKAKLIILLKELDFSIAEIKDTLAICESKEDLPFFLEEKKAFIEKNMQREKELIHKLNRYLLSKNKEEKKMEYEILVKEAEQVTVASIRYTGKYGDVGSYYGDIYKAVKDNAAGAPFNCYYDEDYKEDADIEACIPVKQLLSLTDTKVTCRKLPSCRVISTIHEGSYDKLGQAYKAVIDYAAKNQLTLKTPSREIYHKGPGMIFKGNPHKYVTEILVPVE